MRHFISLQERAHSQNPKQLTFFIFHLLHLPFNNKVVISKWKSEFYVQDQNVATRKPATMKTDAINFIKAQFNTTKFLLAG